MATSGVLWTPDKNRLISILKEYNGVLTKSAIKLNVDRNTLKKKIDEDIELTQLVSNLRNNYENTILDKAEDCVLNALDNQSSDPNNALKSAFYVLNSKGSSRGWSNTLANIQMAPSQIDLENKEIEIQALKAKVEELERQSKAS